MTYYEKELTPNHSYECGNQELYFQENAHLLSDDDNSLNIINDDNVEDNDDNVIEDNDDYCTKFKQLV